MEKIIFIATFAWLILSCQEQETLRKYHESCFSMTISNALPVQFWLDGEESYNTKDVCGVEPICWCQPFECDDEIAIQFTDDSGAEEPVEEVVVLSDIPSLIDWLNHESGDSHNWTTGIANPTVNLPQGGALGESSEYLYTDYVFTEGYQYEISFTYTRTDNDPGENPRQGILSILSSAFGVLFTVTHISSAGSNTATITFTATAACDKIGFRFSSGSDRDITAISVEGTKTGIPEPEPDPAKNFVLKVLNSSTEEIVSIPFTNEYIGNLEYLYQVALIPSSEGICNEQVSFQIIDEDTSPGTLVAYSDCISVRETHPCTLPIDYTNNKNFNGIIYTGISPQPTFRVRIPAIFFEEDNPTEQEDLELSNGEIVRLYNKIEKRKKLDVGFIPPYVHEKLQFVLMHDSITIDGREWIRREVYEKQEGNRRYPLKRASVFLHDKNFIKENQL